MAVFLNRPVRDLVQRGRLALGMTHKQFGEALRSSQRTAERWAEGRSTPSVEHVKTLARLVFPKNRALATELAAACSESLVSLGLVAEPKAPAIPRSVLFEAVVSAAAEAAQVHPGAARAGLAAAFARAAELGVSVSELAESVTSVSSVAAKKA
jgi:transcriptional regulator with XRE-family HTH domain